ncbi:MAG: ribonuclease Y [Planctomycetota bacterium]
MSLLNDVYLALAQVGPPARPGPGPVGGLITRQVVLAIIVIVAAIVGAAFTLAAITLLRAGTLKQAREEADRLTDRARADADTLRDKAAAQGEREAVRIRENAEKDITARSGELRDLERDLARKQDRLELDRERLDDQTAKLEESQEEVEEQREVVKRRRAELDRVIADEKAALLRAADMSQEEASHRVLRLLEDDVRQEMAEVVRREVEKATSESQEKARDIVLNAMERYAGEIATETTVRTVQLPSDDVKGRIIGREGRNIKAFQQITGVDLIVDDTPGVVVVSSFDKVRQTVAAEALEKLLTDGRIHPTRIEEVVGKKREEVDERVRKHGEEAVTELRLRRVHPQISEAMGRLMFRSSYGQNVLKHSIEVAYLSQMIADQLGLNGRIARRCGFLHDIGKAMDHEMEGPHPAVGCEFARRFGEKEPVLNVIAGHHGDIPATTFYTPIIMAADALSGARPGARRESMEKYIQKLEQLQEIALDSRGVTEAHAVQAGREVRVMVDANELSDDEAFMTARQIAERVSKEMTFPGEIKVTVLRETRAVEVAR